jgi:DNA (cytosine-5)-methyltransferase 1
LNAYYNEIDPFAAQWLRNLISAGHIAPGDVDERSIVHVRADDLAGYTQCHFFAGIGGWSYALRLAGWPDDRPVWTGSCPCQDFSLVGKLARFDGDRDLWPVWYQLIRECGADCIFGEQVDDAPEWADRASADMEDSGYAFAPIVIPAVAVGSPQERARLYFAAYANEARRTHAQRMPAAQARSGIRRPSRLVPRETPEYLRGPTEPDQSWIVDGLSGEGFVVGAFGNAIHAPLAAQFIAAADEAMNVLDAGKEG